MPGLLRVKVFESQLLHVYFFVKHGGDALATGAPQPLVALLPDFLRN